VHLPEQDEQEAAKREAAILRQKAEKLLAQADDLSMILSSGGDEKSAILRDRARRANNEAARILDEVNKHKAYCEMLKRSNPPTPYHEMYPLLWALSITSNYTIQHNCKWYSRGLVSRLLNLGSSNPPTVSPVYTNFHYNEAPSTKKHLSEDMMDRNAMLSSLRSNLLRNPDKQIYTSTELDHPKRS
jgi:hypothetical protein